MSSDPRWRDDIDALQFEPAGHGGLCLVHRLAFRRLLGVMLSADAATPTAQAAPDAAAADRSKTPASRNAAPAAKQTPPAARTATPAAEDCLAFFTAYQPAFAAAAGAKISAQQLPPGRSFHLNSRDVTRQMTTIF